MTRERKPVSAVEGTSVPLAAYITDKDGNAATQADFAGGTITYTVTNDTTDTLITSGSLTVADVISDTVLTVGWDGPLPGYNFDHAFAPASFPDGDTDYRLDVMFVMGDGFTDIARWMVQTEGADIA